MDFDVALAELGTEALQQLDLLVGELHARGAFLAPLVVFGGVAALRCRGKISTRFLLPVRRSVHIEEFGRLEMGVSSRMSDGAKADRKSGIRASLGGAASASGTTSACLTAPLSRWPPC